ASRVYPNIPSFPTRRSSDLIYYSITGRILHMIGVYNTPFRIIVLLKKMIKSGSIEDIISQYQRHFLLSNKISTNNKGLRKSLWRSEEHTSELQSRENLVCRL